MKILSILLLLNPLIFAVVIDCEFESYSWTLIGSKYTCLLKKNPSINSLNTFITAANGNHYNSSMSHENVQGFYSTSSFYILHYMPHGLSKIFPNLIAILINYSQMKEIHQKDLEQYEKLKYIQIWGNDIEYLEKDLFKYNTELEYISFGGNNKINQIYPTIFDHLSKLQQLYLSRNQCIQKDRTDRSGVLELIKEVKILCSTTLFLDQLEHFNETNRINFESVKNQLIEKSSKIESILTKQNEKFNQQTENILKNVSKHMNQQDKKLMTKTDEQHREVNQNLHELKSQLKSEIIDIKNELKMELTQKFVNVEKNVTHQFFFIALPLICLFTSLNVAMIILCCRKYAKIGKRQKQSNDVELEERNL
ncbi:hypothetical protein PVAND_016344 [Polypedilum vanderplanki]|uniref:Uncharacterized protein n=1 Tax=Polypedilum vanderplanki TaxID=319348 RepID=A0A9J6BEW3_POLVA|nr:hypothetical protein PVAND_016344 [Polypedilum vanderplanki]